MSEEAKPTFWRIGNPIVWGFVFTIALASIVISLGVQIGPTGIARYREFSGLPFNAVGDTLAGIFAPLAFIWIVVTVFLQGQELSEQRKELELTRQELRLAREAQEKQLATMEVQAAIFTDEKLRRDEAEAKGELDELLTGVRHHLLVGGYASWDTDGDLETGDLIPNARFQAYDEATFFTRVPGSVERTLEALQEIESMTSSIRYPRWPGAFDDAARDITRILESVRPRVSEAMKVRVDRLNLPRISETLASLKADTSIWGNGEDW